MAFGIHSKNLAADFYGQFIPEKPGVQPLGGCGQVHVDYSSLKQSNGLILFFFHCFGSFGFFSESVNEFIFDFVTMFLCGEYRLFRFIAIVSDAGFNN